MRNGYGKLNVCVNARRLSYIRCVCNCKQMELAVDLWRFRVGLLLHSVSPRMVQAHFGVCLEGLAVIWLFVHQHFAVAGLRGVNLLWVLYFLRIYPTEDQGANFCGVTRLTFRRHTWAGLRILYDHLNTVCVLDLKINSNLDRSTWKTVFRGLIAWWEPATSILLVVQFRSLRIGSVFSIV